MIRLTKLAVAIALGLQSLGVMAISEQADTLTKSQLESSAPNFGESVDMTPDEARLTVLGFIDTYMAGDNKIQLEKHFNEEKYMELEKFILSKDKTHRTIRNKYFEDAADALTALLNHQLEVNPPPMPKRKPKFEGPIELTESAAKLIVEGFIDKHMTGDTKIQAMSLLNEDKFKDLEEFFLTGPLMDTLSTDDQDFKDAAHALDTLIPDDDTPDDEEEDDAEVEDTEEELSELKTALADTQEELKELLSLVDGV